MQTFLPYADFETTARTLDQRRLGKQRVETLQIMTTLITGRGWTHHPAVKMWEGFEFALMDYQTAICREWVDSFAFQDTCLDKTWAIFTEIKNVKSDYPWWLGSNDIHRGYQSNLIRKDPVFYGRKFPEVPDDLPYVWPV
jgi:hypothetical protein